MPPKRKVVAKKAVVTEEIPELNVIEENCNTLNVPSHDTIQRNVGRTLDNEINSALEKLHISDRMENANTNVEMEINLPKNVINVTLSDDVEEDKKQLKSTNTSPKRVIAEKDMKNANNPRNIAISEDRQTQIEEKFEAKSRQKQGKVESVVSPSCTHLCGTFTTFTMPPKWQVISKKAVVTEVIPELIVEEENCNTLNETIQRKVDRTLDNEMNSSLEKLRIIEERMANANTKVEIEINLPKNLINVTLSDDDEDDKKQLKSTKIRPKRVIGKKNMKMAINPRKRALSEDRQTQIEEKVEVKSRRKQDKMESAVSTSVVVKKKMILRSFSLDRLASAKPITIDIKNKNKNKPTITGESSKPPQRRALKNKEELPLKSKRTKKNILNSEENVPVISPPDKLKIKCTKKKQVFIDKEAVNLDTLQELPNQTAKTEMASKKSKSPTNKIKIVLEGDVKAPKEINKPDEN